MRFGFILAILTLTACQHAYSPYSIESQKRTAAGISTPPSVPKFGLDDLKEGLTRKQTEEMFGSLGDSEFANGTYRYSKRIDDTPMFLMFSREEKLVGWEKDREKIAAIKAADDKAVSELQDLQREDRQRRQSAARAMLMHRPTSCTHTGIGNTVYTNCN